MARSLDVGGTTTLDRGPGARSRPSPGVHRIGIPALPDATGAGVTLRDDSPTTSGETHDENNSAHRVDPDTDGEQKLVPCASSSRYT